ncbi:hypothetical protein ABB37_04202 [Leptomonas pyrrhocoris]|uniref:adenylate cyclase n=1 Tax=Leptomonas pyrrhocoris TaxID=157538 RepID=A0A0M9G277_LEPPY|nr:hypothetical protein ABB37_04202 [Leptomonas pyrrhocoris]KPA80743.1 hypothetical protein ABB37_04202 [Leptomonas pyrrhocoris]|eukprot:XP_015659182.1 hypothetical protein ABB37_04202 [Leptomonas pyrrhocoris]
MEPASSGKVTGVYGGDRVPGAYLKTRTGVVRGEELFSRPDLERPWRSADKQRTAAAIALKEKEIEELVRLCSNLRTELGNAKSDMRYVEYAVTEKSRQQLEEKKVEMNTLRDRVDELEKQQRESAEAAESQIRLLRSQGENAALGLKSEARIATERCAELAKMYQKQIEDVKAAGVREVEYVESRFKARVEELTSELKAVRETHGATVDRYREQEAQSQSTVFKVEADYKERLRSSEQRVEDQRKEYEAQLAKERKDKESALAEARKGVEKLAKVLADKDDLVEKQKLWNGFLLSHLDAFYHNFVAASPDIAVEPVSAQLQQLPDLYVPRCILEDPEAKVAVERVAYRVMQLKQMKDFPVVSGTPPSPQQRLPTVDLLDHVTERQTRLLRALHELEDRQSEMDTTVASVVSRLCFFSDNLESCLRDSPPAVPPPLRDVVFVCLCVPAGRVMWAANTEMMRSSMQLLYSALRLKMGEYGCYECYSDDVSMLLAFANATAACRFCTESQEWLLRLPWPAELLQMPEGQEERTSGGRVVYRGLRVSMALHAGEAYVEPSGIVFHRTYRHHYYGTAVSQLVHICALAQGGQIIASAAAWNLCVRRKNELGALAAKSLGSSPIAFFNSQSGIQERQNIELVQILPMELEGRSFKSPDRAAVPTVSALTGVKESVLAAEVAAVESQRERMRDAVALLQEEGKSIQNEMGGLVERARAAQPYFHVLPPSEMVSQMNDLYSVMEKVAIRAEELYGDLQDVAHAQEELEAQTRGIKEYFLQQEVLLGREDDLRTETEAVRQHFEQQLQKHREKHRAEVDRLQQSVQEKEQAMRKAFQQFGTK